MKLTIAGLAALFILSACQDATPQAADEPVPTMSVNDLMITVVTPATDTLWGIEDPQTDEDWQVFVDAANAVIDAGETIKVGGTGPNDPLTGGHYHRDHSLTNFHMDEKARSTKPLSRLRLTF